MYKKNTSILITTIYLARNWTSYVARYTHIYMYEDSVKMG